MCGDCPKPKSSRFLFTFRFTLCWLATGYEKRRLGVVDKVSRPCSEISVDFVQVDNSAAKAVCNNFASLFGTEVPSPEDKLVEAVLACFRKGFEEVRFRSFMPDLQGGSLPSASSATSGAASGGAGPVSVSGSADSLSAGTRVDVTGAGPVGSGGDGSGSASGGPAGSRSSARGGNPETRSYDKSWRVVDAHNVMGKPSTSNPNPNRITHPVQLLAYSFGAPDPKGSTMRQLRQREGVLGAFAVSHVYDLHKAVKPAAKAQEQQRMW